MTRQMKDSGVEWIGEIPEDWEIVRTKNIATLFNGNSIKDDEKSLYEDSSNAIPYISTKDIDGFHKINYHNGMYVKKDNPNFKVARKNSTLMCIEGGSAEIKKGKLNQDVCFVNKLCCLEPKSIDSDYLYYFLNTPNYEDHFKSLLSGLIGGVSISDLKTINCTLPPPVDQKEIVTFLNEKCGAIDEIIAKTEQSIEEYKKLKQSVITEAVTKGVRPNRKMKDSGVEWIGEIPADWDIKRLRYIADKFLKGNGITKDEVRKNGNMQCVRYGEIYSKYNVSFKSCFSRINVEEVSNPQYVSYGDILFAGTGELIEEIGKNIVYIGEKQCVAGGDIIVLKHKQNPSFLNYSLNCSYTIFQKSRNKIKLKVVHISPNEIKNIIMVLPPISEQKEIADYLDKKCEEIDAIIEKKQQFLIELATYKKSLIYEYVTGKKEVV